MDDGNGEVAFARTSLGYTEAFGGESSIEGIADRLRRYSLETVVGVVSRISLVLSKYGDRGFREGQTRLLLHVFGRKESIALVAAAAARTGKGIDLGRRAVFHERQMQNLLKVAFNVLPVDPLHGPEPSLTALGEALLMMSDVLDASFDGLDPDTEDGKRALQLYIFANMVFHQGRSELAEFARAYDLFLGERPDLQGYIDLHQRLAMVTGLPAVESWYVLRGLHALYFTIDIDSLDTRAPVLNVEDAFRERYDFTAAQSAAFFDTAARGAVALKTAVERAYPLTDLRFYDNLVFARNPIVLFGQRAWCLSLPLLRDAAGSNLQHRFVDPAVFPISSDRDRFYSFRGQLLDDYIQRSLLRTFPNLITGSQLAEDASGDPNGSKSCDGAAQIGDTIFLFETKSSILSLAARTASSWEAYVTQIERAVIDGIEQIDATLQRIEGGRSKHRGLDPTKIKRYIPISVVTDFPVDPITYAFISDVVAAKGWLSQAKASPLQVLELAEVELLETAVARSRDLISLFDWKLANENNQAMPFKNFCLRTGEAWVHDHNPYLERRFFEIEPDWHKFFDDHRKP